MAGLAHMLTARDTHPVRELEMTASGHTGSEQRRPREVCPGEGSVCRGGTVGRGYLVLQRGQAGGRDTSELEKATWPVRAEGCVDLNQTHMRPWFGCGPGAVPLCGHQSQGWRQKLEFCCSLLTTVQEVHCPGTPGAPFRTAALGIS